MPPTRPQPAGRWLDFIGGSRLKLALSPHRYKAALAREARLRNIVIDFAAEDEEIYDEARLATCHCLAEHVLLDWSGVTSHGQERPYTPAEGTHALLTSSKLFHFVTTYGTAPSDALDEIKTRAKNAVTWDMEWSKGSEALYESWRKTGVVPPALQRKPDLTPDLVFYLEAFYFLSAFRAPAFSGPGPLNFADIVRYAELNGYTSPEDIQFFSEVILACDGAFREVIAKKTPPPSKNTAKPTRR